MQSVPVEGKGKGKQITGTFNIITAGKFLHMQLYTEETQHCYPKGILFADGFDVTTPKNDWNNETLAIQCVIPSTFITSSFRTLKRCVIQHLHNIIIPYFEAMREKLGLPENQKCLLIYDVFKAQSTDKYCEHLDVDNILYVPTMVRKRGNK